MCVYVYVYSIIFIIIKSKSVISAISVIIENSM